MAAGQGENHLEPNDAITVSTRWKPDGGSLAIENAGLVNRIDTSVLGKLSRRGQPAASENRCS